VRPHYYPPFSSVLLLMLALFNGALLNAPLLTAPVLTVPLLKDITYMGDSQLLLGLGLLFITIGTNSRSETLCFITFVS